MFTKRGPCAQENPREEKQHSRDRTGFSSYLCKNPIMLEAGRRKKHYFRQNDSWWASVKNICWDQKLLEAATKTAWFQILIKKFTRINGVLMVDGSWFMALATLPGESCGGPEPGPLLAMTYDPWTMNAFSWQFSVLFCRPQFAISEHVLAPMEAP